MNGLIGPTTDDLPADASSARTCSAGACSEGSEAHSRDVARPYGGERDLAVRAGASGFRARSTPESLRLEHPLTADTVSDQEIVAGLCGLVEEGLIVGQQEFERAFTEVVQTCAPDPDAAWRHFYRNSVRELRSVDADFSPVHRRARSLLVGTSVLEVGSCFGLLALQCAQDGYRVSACDICPGALELLDAAAADFGVALSTTLGDARALPYPADSSDTVTLIHLLEHLDGADVDAAIGEALRVARRRVVIAVPYEQVPNEHFGHRLSLSEDDLRRWAARWPDYSASIFDDHGGWLVLEPLR